MRLATTLLVLVAPAWLLFPAAAEEGDAGLEATVTDTYDYQMKVSGLVFKMKAEPGAAVEALSLDHIPLVSDGKAVNLWLAQIGTAEFSPAEKGRIAVKAVLQGRGDEVAGSVEEPGKCFFEGLVPPRVGGGWSSKTVRFPLTQVKSLKVHTKYEALVEGGRAGTIPPLPAPNEDVLWVSSVPLGAEVYAKPLEGRETAFWKDYKRLGRTPFTEKVPPGKYAVRVFVPSDLAGTLKPSTKLGEDTNPFEPDGWSELNFRQGENVVESMTYEVQKNEGRAATLISLFQFKDLKPSEALESFPAGHNFHFLDKKLEGVLLNRNVPKTEIPVILEALHRGGKMVWHGDEQSLMMELQPGERGWDIREALRRKGK